ncbi:amino acid ABC transporter permease [Frigidibacter sp. SD6-1]|uniref:amino acid ABC transporter permease n=1 Tax=Frigidibacter sp. SD6-1 TaxID=3032581 RepID=UPI0024E015B4|nr:amino acid ABC transporter permease [Frigidibacter sp. SD6-1]
MATPTPTFVRTEMLGPQEPPISQSGAVKWLRENLFSTPLNSLLTLLGLAFAYLVLRTVVPWAWNGVWSASSLGECRQIIAETLGPDSHAACWAVIGERWQQFIFGFYPLDLYWRPVLAFGLLFCALGPILYFGQSGNNLRIVGASGLLTLGALLGVRHFVAKANPPSDAILSDNPMVLVIAVVIFALLGVVAKLRPQKLVWFSILYPLIGFYLLWGGSVWAPIGTLVGFVILALVWYGLQRQVGVVVAGGAGLVTAAVWWIWVQSAVTDKLNNAIPLGLLYERSDQFGGFLLAFVIGVAAISASLPIGILLALGRRSDMFLIKTLSVGFIEFVRGVPLITMLFVASLLLQYFLPPQTNFDLILRVIILVTLFSAAYIAEVIRGGLAALPRGQYEAADALGLDYWQAQRLIIMPQALKISIPGIVSSFIGLFKDTTLVALVGLADPLQGITKIVRADINWKGIYWEPYLFVGLIFFAVCFSMSRYSMYLERKLKRDHR